MTTNVFTYGILMADAACPATLQGYRLDFAGHATVVEEQAGTVYGGLLRDVPAERLESYDRIEGVPRYYTRREVTVTSADGPARAWVYVMNPEHLDGGKRDAAAWTALFGDDPATWIGSLVARLHDLHERLGSPIRAHDELDYRAARWADEIREEAADVPRR